MYVQYLSKVTSHSLTIILLDSRKLVTFLSTIWCTHVHKIFEGRGLGWVTNLSSLKYVDH